MIVRIVKMQFLPEHIEDFKKLFDDRKEKIRNFPGCRYLELLQGLEEESNVFMTYSYWETNQDLNNYRYSELFKETWSATKKMFSKKAEAISTQKLHNLT